MFFEVGQVLADFFCAVNLRQIKPQKIEVPLADFFIYIIDIRGCLNSSSYETLWGMTDKNAVRVRMCIL